MYTGGSLWYTVVDDVRGRGCLGGRLVDDVRGRGCLVGRLVDDVRSALLVLQRVLHGRSGSKLPKRGMFGTLALLGKTAILLSKITLKNGHFCVPAGHLKFSVSHVSP